MWCHEAGSGEKFGRICRWVVSVAESAGAGRVWWSQRAVRNDHFAELQPKLQQVLTQFPGCTKSRPVRCGSVGRNRQTAADPVLFCRLDSAGLSHPVCLICLPPRSALLGSCFPSDGFLKQSPRQAVCLLKLVFSLLPRSVFVLICRDCDSQLQGRSKCCPEESPLVQHSDSCCADCTVLR